MLVMLQLAHVLLPKDIVAAPRNLRHAAQSQSPLGARYEQHARCCARQKGPSGFLQRKAAVPRRLILQQPEGTPGHRTRPSGDQEG